MRFDRSRAVATWKRSPHSVPTGAAGPLHISGCRSGGTVWSVVGLVRTQRRHHRPQTRDPVDQVAVARFRAAPRAAALQRIRNRLKCVRGQSPSPQTRVRDAALRTWQPRTGPRPIMRAHVTISAAAPPLTIPSHEYSSTAARHPRLPEVQGRSGLSHPRELPRLSDLSTGIPIREGIPIMLLSDALNSSLAWLGATETLDTTAGKCYDTGSHSTRIDDDQAA